MPLENFGQFEIQKLLLDAHSDCPIHVRVAKGLFGFITTIVIGIPKDAYDWLVTEIGDVVGPGATDFINGDHDFGEGAYLADFGSKHTTLLGLWRDV